MTKKAEKSREVEPKREPTEGERRAIARARERHADRPCRAAFAIGDGECRPGVFDVQSPHTDEEGQPYLVSDTFGSTSSAFTLECVLQLINSTAKDGEPNMQRLNASLALVGAIEPRDELEAALAVQMAATHDLSVDLLRKAKGAEHLGALRDYGNLATKLSRTFAQQMKTLAEWRRGGEQVVRHIHVNEGGQAVFAETLNIGGQNGKIGNQAHGPGAALLGPNPAGYALPMPSNEGEEAVPHPRRSGRIGSAQGQQECVASWPPVEGAPGDDGDDPAVSERGHGGA